MIIMSVDTGKARTGIAVSDRTEFLASPVEVIKEGYMPHLLEKTAAAARRLGAELIVVGLPRNMDGSEGESAANSRLFAEELTKLCGIETVMFDERCTTMAAHTYLNSTNTRGKKRKETVDAVAAVIILQDYLDSKRR
ncbi:MAG: Holliday junction resolvase RuvX [Oscillospiraceae bacterium]|jgi:putative Holliday junction resolvase|nr:Holliday junction resolvase RuvX [Oscillospiraceae bacterium]